MPTIVLNQWEITADYLEDDLLDGVMPVLFADDVKAAEAAISEAPLTAKRDLERLAKMFYKFCGLLVSRKENICISLVLVALF